MPWVEEVLRHDTFLDDLFNKVFRRFEDKNGNKWWQDFNDKVPKVDLYKITFEKGLFVKTDNGYTTPTYEKKGNLCITRHIIMRRWDNEYLAFAQSTGAVKVNTGDMPKDRDALLAWLVKFYHNFVNYTTLYSYTMDKYEGYTHFETSDGKTAPVTVMTHDNGVGVLKASLDIEVFTEEHYFPETFQSPIMVMNLKGDSGENFSSIGKFNYKTNTNYWPDSLIQLKGVFDETSAFFTLKVDSAPVWEDNIVTVVPFFFGNLVVKGMDETKRNETPIAMLGGTQVDKFFDFDSVEDVTETLQPITRNYVHHPSNGIDSVMVKRSKYGSRYQSHYLRWNVPPNEMPPTREEIRQLAHSLTGVQATHHVGHRLPDRFEKGQEWLPIHDWSNGYDDIQESKYVVLGDKEICKVVEVDVENHRLRLKRSCGGGYSHEKSTEVKFFIELDGEKARKYPRAWNYLHKCYYEYDFHPSRYSGKVHSSRAIVMHPEDGVVGYIPNVVLLPLINIMEGDKLRFHYFCTECEEEPYEPTAPEGSDATPWVPYVPDDGGNNGGNDGDNDGEDEGQQNPQEPNEPPKEGTFSYMCDGSINADDIDDSYWNLDYKGQEFVKNSLGREISQSFWQGRNDLLEFFDKGNNSAESGYNYSNAIITIKDFHKFLWKALQDVENGTVSITQSWADFKKWCDENIPCLTDLEKASLFMTCKIKRPTLFFTGSEGFLQDDILDIMAKLINKVPKEFYDWVDFNNVYIETADDQASGSVVGAFVHDYSAVATYSDGTKENIFDKYNSYVNFEPQILGFGMSVAKAMRPHDYIKPGQGWGQAVVGGEYTDYYNHEMTQDNYKAYVAAEIAIHEMAHAISNRGFDLFGTHLHEMQEWLDISGWKVSGYDSYGNPIYAEIIKSNPGTLTDDNKLAPVTDYGCMLPSEDFAEAFRFYVFNREFLKDKFKAKYDFIRDKLSAMGINPDL